MTEAEWLAATDPTRMLSFLVGKASDRKLRLFAVASATRAWHLLDADVFRSAITSSERAADGEISPDELRATLQAASEVLERRTDAQSRDERGQLGTNLNPAVVAARQRLYAAGVATHVAGQDTFFVASMTPLSTAMALSHGYAPNYEVPGQGVREVLDEHGPPDADALRCLFGNPFRLVALDRSWLTSTVVALANGIYADRAFDRLPILADALQDAGCDNADVLTHCRGDGPHVRGCWVVDLLTGRA